LSGLRSLPEQPRSQLRTNDRRSVERVERPLPLPVLTSDLKPQAETRLLVDGRALKALPRDLDRLEQGRHREGHRVLLNQNVACERRRDAEHFAARRGSL